MKTLLLGISAFLAISAAPCLSSAQEVQPQPMAGQEWNGEAYPDPAYQQQQPAGAPEMTQMDPNGSPQESLFSYAGPHPLPYDQGGGFCNEQGPHQHPFPVFDSHLFRQANGLAYFVGDPADFGYAAGGYTYSGNHPIDAGMGGGYCYMGWPHHHLFAPTSVQYVMQGGAYVYNGAWDADYYTQLALYQPYYSGYYRQWYLGGRYYSLRPQHAYMGWGWHRPFVGGGYRGYGTAGYRPGYGGYGYRAPGYGGSAYRAPGYNGYGYRAPAYGGGYRAPAYGGGYRAPTYGGGYRAPAYGGGYRAPAYGGGGYRGPVAAPAYRPAPVYQAGQGGYRSAPVYRQAAPAYRAAPSFHSAPAFHGGGGGGGGAHFGGGGGHFGGGGGHVGGGGGHFGGGGGHGGRR